jgi:cytoskeletal protein RodZ
MSDRPKEKDKVENLINKDEDSFERNEMDVLELPPRKDSHQSKSRTKWKISTVWMRFLLVLFIILIMLILSYRYWDDWFGEKLLESEILINETTPYHEEITIER